MRLSPAQRLLTGIVMVFLVWFLGHHMLFLNVGTHTNPQLEEGKFILISTQPLQTVWHVRSGAIDRWDGDGAVEYLIQRHSHPLYNVCLKRGKNAVKESFPLRL